MLSGAALRSANTFKLLCVAARHGALRDCTISDKRSQNRHGTRDTITENASTRAATQHCDAHAQKRAASAPVQRRDVRCTITPSLRRYDARANTFYRIRATHPSLMRKALALLVAGSVRAALDPLLPAASPWTLSTRRRWTLSRATRRLVFEETGSCWFDDDANEEGTWEVRGDAVSFTTDCSQNVTRHYHCLLHRNHGLSGNFGQPRLVRGVTARDRVGGRARLFRPVLGAFSAASLDYDRRGEAHEEDDGALLDADGAPR